MLSFPLRRSAPFFLLQLLLAIVIIAASVPAQAAPLIRPFSGTGILVIRPLPAARAPEAPGMVLYRQPGVARLTTVAAARLPSLAPALKPVEGETVAIVMEKRGVWLRIVFDDAGRTGWLPMERAWDFFSWYDYLPGKKVKLLPGLKKSFYSLKAKAEEDAPLVATLQPGKPLWVGDVEGDWCELESPGNGWLRWRDGDGRLLVAIDGGDAPQNR